jgi:tetratricopeptide (TPR) repeat protein
MEALTEPRAIALLRRRRVGAARTDAERRWKEIRSFGSSERQSLVERLEEFRTWAVAERLATESALVAPKSVVAAVDLARLAVRVAELAEVGEGFRKRLEGFARAFLANGLRVAGRLREADVEMEAAKVLWRGGADPRAVLPGWRLLDLEASLRRDQGRFGEALELLDRAGAVAPAAAVGRILVNKGSALEQAGNIAGAVAALREAGPLVEATGTLRDKCVLGFNLTVNLCHLGHFEEAKERLATVRKLAQGLGNSLDLLKVQWLSGRVAAGLGRREEACRALEQVREQFAAGNNAFATAMLSLELAVLHLEAGRTGEVRALAESMVRIFVTEGDHPDALIAVRLFQEAARQETATVEGARRLMVVIEGMANANVWALS